MPSAEGLSATRDGHRSERQIRSPSPFSQHFGAWWELYIHTFYRRLGYAVDVHPTMPNGTTPDFVVTRDGVSTYVECKAIPEKPGSVHQAWILDCTS